jgi:hypothetical protein
MFIYEKETNLKGEFYIGRTYTEAVLRASKDSDWNEEERRQLEMIGSYNKPILDMSYTRFVIENNVYQFIKSDNGFTIQKFASDNYKLIKFDPKEIRKELLRRGYKEVPRIRDFLNYVYVTEKPSSDLLKEYRDGDLLNVLYYLNRVRFNSFPNFVWERKFLQSSCFG